MGKRRAVVTGIGAITPLGNSTDGLYRALLENRSGIRAMTEWRDEFGRNIAGAPVVLDPAEVKKISRKVRRTMGNAALFAGLAAQEAVNQSGLEPEFFTSGRVGCVIGSTVGSASSMTEACVADYEGRRNDLSACHFFRLMSHSSSFNVADMFGINGPQLSTNSACASGLQALGTALELIQLGKVDAVLAGGSDESTPLVASSFQLLYALAEEESPEPDKLSRPFDAGRTGLVCSEGAGILVVEELEHAKRRGAPILFELAGYATNCSGWHVSHSDELQIANCMHAALADAGINAEEVDYVSAHATGTRVGEGVFHAVGDLRLVGVADVPSRAVGGVSDELEKNVGAAFFRVFELLDHEYPGAFGADEPGARGVEGARQLIRLGTFLLGEGVEQLERRGDERRGFVRTARQHRVDLAELDQLQRFSERLQSRGARRVGRQLRPVDAEHVGDVEARRVRHQPEKVARRQVVAPPFVFGDARLGHAGRAADRGSDHAADPTAGEDRGVEPALRHGLLRGKSGEERGVAHGAAHLAAYFLRFGGIDRHRGVGDVLAEDVAPFGHGADAGAVSLERPVQFGCGVSQRGNDTDAGNDGSAIFHRFHRIY